MKLFCWTIWILGLVLISATLDAVPDPPAAKPSSALSSSLQPHPCICDNPALTCNSLRALFPPAATTAAAASEPVTRGETLVLTRQAADSSPPSARGV